MEPHFERIVFVPLFAELLANVCKTEAPRKGTEKGVNDEASQVHLRNASRKGDEGSDHRQQPAGEDDQFAASREPSVSHVEVVQRNENIASVFFDDGPSAVH